MRVPLPAARTIAATRSELIMLGPVLPITFQRMIHSAATAGDHLAERARNWHTPAVGPNQRLLRKMKRNALVFDLDGTLVDSIPDLEAALNETLREVGAPALPRAAVRFMVGDGTTALVARALAASGLPETLLAERLARFLALYEAAPVARSHAYPGVVETLAALRREGRRLAICTNKPQRATLAVLRGLALEGFFAAIVGGDVLPVKKTDPRPLPRAVAAPRGTVRRGGGGRGHRHQVPAGACRRKSRHPSPHS